MKKIMLSDKFGLTQAVLDGRKTQTRRLILPQPDYDEHKGMIWKGYMYGIKGYNAPYDAYDNFISTLKKFNRLPYNIGEEVAVAQSYQTVMKYYHSLGNVSTRVVSEEEKTFWNAMRKIESTGNNSAMQGDNNKMFTKSSLMPHRIKITNVRIERLQDISEEDCLKEGLEWVRGLFYVNYNKETGSRMYLGDDYQNAFATLIDKVSGKGTWACNPWVFVYDFELIR